MLWCITSNVSIKLFCFAVYIHLSTFSYYFGAHTFRNGCLRFMDLWKQKHESGQWIEIEAEEAMSDCSASGIVLSSMTSEPRVSEPAGNNAITAGKKQT